MKYNTFKPGNYLTGYQENITPNGQTLKRAAVFADYLNQAWLDVANKTWLGQRANNFLSELEAAMAKHSVALPYVANTAGDMAMHLFTFPTKMSEYGSPNGITYVTNDTSPYWLSVVYQCELYTRNLYDLLENTPTRIDPDPIFSPYYPDEETGLMMCLEHERILIGYNVAAPLYTEGWIRYNWDSQTTPVIGAGARTTTRSGQTITFTGTPVLASVLYQTGTGNNWAEADAAYIDGVVSINGVNQAYYQYSD